ncbi:MAG: hypothetical protein KDD50_07880 [Bdellovibrionales bacterium]|nr:hypothetical protein [Bdellovibrionales bacterium]
MMKLIFSVIFLLGSLCYADTPPKVEDSNKQAQELYLEGTNLYQNKDYQGAFEKFSKSLEEAPFNPYILYNMSLSAFKIQKVGYALGGLRRALYVDPYFGQANEFLTFLTQKVNPPTEELGFWEFYRDQLLSAFSFNVIFFLTLFFCVYAGILLIRYFAKKKHAFLKDLRSPAVPWAGYISFFLFVLCLLVLSSKIYDYIVPRGTLVITTQDLKSGPGDDFNSLLKVTEGQELIINQSREDWAQVKLPGGISGWVPKSSLFFSSGRSPW